MPSEHPKQIIVPPFDEVYLTPSDPKFLPETEQSAIYDDIHFNCLSENCKGIILTSECDLVQGSPDDYVLVARICPIGLIWAWWLKTKKDYSDNEIIGEEPLSRGKRKDILEEFSKYYINNRTHQYHFLPENSGAIDASFICFELTECMQVKNFDPSKKICVLKSPFREAVPTRYSAYIGRIGTSAIDNSYKKTALDSVCKLKNPPQPSG